MADAADVADAGEAALTRVLPGVLVDNDASGGGCPQLSRGSDSCPMSPAESSDMRTVTEFKSCPEGNEINCSHLTLSACVTPDVSR